MSKLRPVSGDRRLKEGKGSHMKKQVYNRLTLLSLFVALAAMSLLPAAKADGPTQINSMDFFLQIRGPMCPAGMITSATPDNTSTA